MSVSGDWETMRKTGIFTRIMILLDNKFELEEAVAINLLALMASSQAKGVGTHIIIRVPSLRPTGVT